jgi:hypothetical protein
MKVPQLVEAALLQVLGNITHRLMRLEMIFGLLGTNALLVRPLNSRMQLRRQLGAPTRLLVEVLHRRATRLQHRQAKRVSRVLNLVDAAAFHRLA